AGLTDAINVLGLEDPTQAAVILSPADASALLADARGIGAGSDVMANNLITGANFNVLGVQVVSSNKIDAGEGMLVAHGAVGLVLKRDVQGDVDRDIIKKATVNTADQHYAAYLNDETKVAKQPAGE